MARASQRLRRLWDTYSFAGFRAEPTVRGIFGDPKARVITLRRRSKKRRVGAVVGSSLKWQRLKPYEKFAAMIDRHWDGIAAYCRPDNKVSLGFVEGLNNKIRVIQRRAYGLHDKDYLRLKVLTCMLPRL